jgi:hypothetical protein
MLTSNRNFRLALAVGLFLFVLAPLVHGECRNLPAGLEAPPLNDHYLTKNPRYIFVVHDGGICLKERKPGSAWHKMPLPPQLKNKVKEIAVDGPKLVARGRDNRIFFMRQAMQHRYLFMWTAQWGVPLGLGGGLWLSPGTTLWDFSFISPRLDREYIDSAGQSHTIGFGVSTLFEVGEDGQEIVSYDPWLQPDKSIQVCGPKRGRLRILAISTIGSTIVVMDKYGNIFIVRFDFDMAGGDKIIMGYTYKIRTPRTDFFSWLRAPRKLPIPDWQRLPKIDGVITDHIALKRVGHGARVRRVRVEGLREGRTGFFEAEFDFIDQSPDLNVSEKKPIVWQFHPTDRPLIGRVINNQQDEAIVDLGVSRDRTYGLDLGDSARVSLVDFNRYCSPARVRVSFAEGNDIDLWLHHRETLRVFKKSPESTIKQWGSVEIPEEILRNWENLTNAQQKFLVDHFGNDRFTKVFLRVAPDKVQIKKRGLRHGYWKFGLEPI